MRLYGAQILIQANLRLLHLDALELIMHYGGRGSAATRSSENRPLLTNISPHLRLGYLAFRKEKVLTLLGERQDVLRSNLMDQRIPGNL